jgi:2-methylcitrate dehydratase
MRMTLAEQLADFIVSASFGDISGIAVREFKTRVLDSVGCALGALDNELIGLIKDQIDDFGGRDQCTRIGDGKTAPDRAAFFNCALVRYLDFNDSLSCEGRNLPSQR